MNKQQYLCLNGDNLKSDSPILTAQNRAFRYGDALFETIRCIQQQPMFFEDHYKRLLQGMTLLKMDTKGLPPVNVFKKQIAILISKNRLFTDVRVRLTIFRHDGGLYTPFDNSINYLIETTPLASNNYTLNSKGLLISLYQSDVKPINRFAQFKSANSLLFVMAGLFKKENNLDEVLILNEREKIIESMASNLFWIKDGHIYTPLRSSGCVDGIMRKQIMTIIRSNGWPLIEVEGTDMDELYQADEIFITNAIHGIQWVVGLGQKRYFCNKVKELQSTFDNYVINYLKDSQES